MSSDAKNNPPEAGRQRHRAGDALDGAEKTSKGMPKIRICAALTRVVITATHKPARAPISIASAVMPSSLARNRARILASVISAGRGAEMIRARRQTR